MENTPIYYRLNPKANIFFDPTNRIKLLPGKEICITPHQVAKSGLLRRAIENGHIQRVGETHSTNVQEKTELSLEEKVTVIRNLHLSGHSSKNIAKKFTLDTLKSICEMDIFSIEVEEGDTKEELVNIILETMATIDEKESDEDETHDDGKETGDEDPDQLIN